MVVEQGDDQEVSAHLEHLVLSFLSQNMQIAEFVKHLFTIKLLTYYTLLKLHLIVYYVALCGIGLSNE